MFTRRLFRCGVCIAAAFLQTVAVSAPPPSPFKYRERQLGVDVELTLYAADQTVANDAAAKAYRRIADLNRVLSDYEEDSEINRLCRTAPPGQPVAVSADLFRVLAASLELSRRTDGAFDVTLGPVIKLWRRARRQKQLPTPEALAEARGKVDYRRITLDPVAKTATLARNDLQVDFGGIGKGFVAQEALATLRAAGVPCALVAVAGDIAAGDAPPDAPGWRIGVAPLDQPDGPPSRWLKLVNAAVSTSGDAFQYIEIDGVRYSHIVDARTGLGMTQRASVTVVAADGLLADGLDTAALVVGPENGVRLIRETPGAAGLFVTRTDAGVVATETPEFRKWLWPE